MQQSRLAVRYAKSLLDLATEQKSVDALFADMQCVFNTCKNNVELLQVLNSPIIHADKKIAILSAIFNATIQPITQSFIALIVKKGREAKLYEISAAFIALVKELKQIKTVKITTASAINDSIKQQLATKIAAGFEGKTVELETAMNADLIGGFVIEMDDKLYDASIRKELNDIKNQFTNNSYISRI